MKTVLITGCDRGVGYCLAECYLQGGWHVYAGQFMPEWPWLDELRMKYPEALTIVPLDVGSTESVCKAAERIESLDMLVCSAGISGGEDEAGIRDVYNVNTLAALRLVEAFLPKMENGMKRLAFISSEAGVITIAHRGVSYGYTVSKAMLNMAVNQMFRQLRPRGYTFRVYHPGWVRSYMAGKKDMNARVEPEESARAAYAQFTQNRTWEDALIMTDIDGCIWPW